MSLTKQEAADLIRKHYPGNEARIIVTAFYGVSCLLVGMTAANLGHEPTQALNRWAELWTKKLGQEFVELIARCVENAQGIPPGDESWLSDFMQSELDGFIARLKEQRDDAG